MKLLLLIINIFLLLTACTVTESAEYNSVEITSQIEPPSSEVNYLSKNTNIALKRNEWSQNNPVPLNQTGLIPIKIHTSSDAASSIAGVLEVSFSNIISGEEAYQFLLNESESNEPPPASYQWIILDAKAKLTTGSKEYPYTVIPNVTTVALDDVKTPKNKVSPVYDNEFGYVDLYQDEETAGKVILLAPKDEEYLIRWDEGFYTSIFFASE